MICKWCDVVMKSGTHYEQGKSPKRYNECPKCGDKVYNNGKNFQEVLHSEIEKQNKSDVPSKFGRRAGTSRTQHR